MESSLGWVDFSEAALQRLRNDLQADGDGVVDEMGLLAIHSGYADRFFPGTSVLHKRVRYALFTCWNYLCFSRMEGTTPRAKKEAAEDWVRRQLKLNNQTGIIGARVDRPAQPVDFIYWTALRTWGLYRGPERTPLLTRWSPDHVTRVTRHVTGDEDVREQPIAAFLVPEPPHFWLRPRPRSALTFSLENSEAEFLVRRLSALPPCLLSIAAGLTSRMSPSQDCLWDDALIYAAAAELREISIVERSKLASAAGHLVRAIYAALVERRRNETETKTILSKLDDQLHYRSQLVALVRNTEITDSIRKLEPDLLQRDLPSVPKTLLAIISFVKEQTSKIRRGSDVDAHLLDDKMLEFFTKEEFRRKRLRARLPDNQHAMERRSGFDAGTLHPSPIDYRWPVVYSILEDLHNGLRAAA